MLGVAENQGRAVRQVHPHHGFRDRQALDRGLVLGDHDRVVIGRNLLGVVIVANIGGDHIFRCDGRVDCLAFLVVVAQPPLVPAQALCQVRERNIEGRVGIVGLLVGAHVDAAPDMHVDARANSIGFAGKHDARIDGVGKILVRRALDGALDVAAQGVAHVDLLSCHIDLHGFECRL